MKSKVVLIFKILIFIIIVVGLGFGIYYVYDKYIKEDDTGLVVKKLNEINGYGYTLSDNDSELYKTEFDNLKENLESKEINYEEYAKSIAKLFVIDLYTLDNKLNKYDVGGTEFIYPDAVENYRLNVENTIYKYVEDNTKGKRDQALPKVNKVDVESITENTFKMKSDNQTYEGYKVNIKIGYYYNLGYDTEAEIIVIKKNNKLYIVEKN